MSLQRAMLAYVEGLSAKEGEETKHQEQAKIILRRLVLWLGESPPDVLPQAAAVRPIDHPKDLSRTHFDAFLRHRRSQPGHKGQTLSEHTINKEITYIKGWLAWLEDDPLEHGLPADWRAPKIKKRKAAWHLPRYLDRPALDRAFLATRFATRPVLSDITAAEWWESLYLLAFMTSLRCGALLSVPRPSERDLEAQQLILPASLDKSGHERSYYLPPLLCSRIRRLPCRPGEPMFVWYTAKGKPATDLRSMYHHMEAFQNRAGIPKAEQNRLHVLRKSTVTHMLQGGAAPTTVQRQTGHTDLKVIMEHYAGDLGPLQREAVDKLYVPAGLQCRDRQRKLFE